MLQRETPRVYPSKEVAIQFARFESGGLQHLEYPSREGLPFADPWCEGVERTSDEGVEAAGPHHHQGTIAQWCSRLNACVCVNGGHFEHKFWVSNFLLCFVCFIDTGFRKCDRYKPVQSANIVWNVLLFVCETFTRYGRNITNVWQIILMPMNVAFSCEVVHDKLWKSVDICDTNGEKSVAPFYVDMV